MIKFRLELSINGEQVFRTVEADDVTKDSVGFIVFYNKTGDDKTIEFVAEYNPAFIVSMTREVDD